MTTFRQGSRNAVEPLPTGFALVTAGRFANNVAVRAVYPFLPAIADGLGVSLVALGSALGLRELAGLTTPLIGGRIDRSDLGIAMALGLVGASVAATLTATSDGLLQFTLALTMLSLAKSLYDVASASWIAHSVPFRFRGRAIGIVELAWAGSFLVGMPIVALLIRAGTWRTPFLLIGVATMPIAFAVYARLAGHVVPPGASRSAPKARLGLLATPIAIMILLGIGHQAVLVSFASWLEDAHGLTIASLGFTAVLLGAAELVGTAASTQLSDRLGKRQCVLAGACALVPPLALLPLGGSSVLVAMVALAVLFAVFEFTFVSLLPLVSEIDPTARATAMAWTLGAFGAGHAVGGAVGATCYESFGIGGIVVLGTLAFTGAAAVIRAGLVEPTEP